MAVENSDPAEVKAASEKVILEAGGRICNWLPYLDRPQPRGLDDLVGRALILNAIINIAFGAPISVIKSWIDAHGAARYLSPDEQRLLQKNDSELTELEVTNLHWSLEALWALMWAGGLTDDLAIDGHVPDHMVSLVPDLQQNDDGAKFNQKMRLRPAEDLYRMLDLYYRAHWFTEDGRINGYATGAISSDIIMERRKALEWLMDDTSDWDHVSLDT